MILTRLSFLFRREDSLGDRGQGQYKLAGRIQELDRAKTLVPCRGSVVLGVNGQGDPTLAYFVLAGFRIQTLALPSGLKDRNDGYKTAIQVVAGPPL